MSDHLRNSPPPVERVALLDAPGPGTSELEFLEKLRAYLDYRSRHVEPPQALSEAWDDFYRSQSDRITRYLRKSGLSPDDRDDCLQCVWGEVLTHLAGLAYDPRRGRLSSWVLAVARNRSIDLLRRRRVSVSLGLEASALQDPCPGPAAACECLSTRARVKSALEEFSTRVTERNFQVFHQRMIEGRTASEVADRLGLTPEQVRYRLHRLKRKFRELLDHPATAVPHLKEPVGS